MSEQLKRGISCHGLDAAFEAEEIHKSNLILEGHFLRAQQKLDEAADKMAEAAEIEERLSAICEEKGLLEKSWVHRFSAANCWAQAGNFHRALLMADDLLARGDLPDRLRQHIHKFTQAIRRRRAEWAAEVELAAAGRVP